VSETCSEHRTRRGRIHTRTGRVIFPYSAENMSPLKRAFKHHTAGAVRTLRGISGSWHTKRGVDVGVHHRQRLTRGGRRPVPAGGRELLAIGLVHPSRPAAVSLPDRRADDASEQERATGGDLDLDPGSVIGALREIHVPDVGRNTPEMKAPHPLATEIRGRGRQSPRRPQPPLRADVGTTPPVHALP